MARMIDGWSDVKTLKMAHSAAVSEGDVIVVGYTVLIALEDALINTEAMYAYGGRVAFPKTSGGGEAIAGGVAAYWNAGTGKLVASAAGNTLAGIVIEPAADADTEVFVELAALIDATETVSLEDLDSGIAPSHVVKFAGKITWSGSGASLATTISGLAATDIVITTIQTAPTQAAYIVTAAPTTNTLTIVLSTANTSNDAVIAYQVLRVAA